MVKGVGGALEFDSSEEFEITPEMRAHSSENSPSTCDLSEVKPFFELEPECRL